MGATFLIALREGLEAALIVGIILGALQKLGQNRQGRTVWAGVGAAIVVAVVGGLILSGLGVVLEGPGEAIFEGLTMFLAACVLTWMIFWMQRQGRQVQASLETDVRRALAAGGAGALFLLAFTAVLREGVETALFLTAASFSTTAVQAWVGTILGLAVAVGLGWLLFAAGRRLRMRHFFLITGTLLLLFSAGMIGRGVHELQEAGVLPAVVEHLWDINNVVNEEGPLGSFLGVLFGYNGNPSLLEVVAYSAYLAVIGTMSLRQRRTVQPVAATRQAGESRVDC